MEDAHITHQLWNTLSEADQFQYVLTLESLLADAQHTLALLPQCPDHGYCNPYFRDWIRAQLGQPVASGMATEGSTGTNEMRQNSEAALAFDRTVRQMAEGD